VRALKKNALYLIGLVNLIVFLLISYSQLHFFLFTADPFREVLTLNNSEVMLIYPGLFLIGISIIYYYYLDIQKTIIFGGIGNLIIFLIAILNIHLLINYSESLEVFIFFFSTISGVIGSTVIYSILLISNFILKQNQIISIKKIVLDLGIHYARLEIRELAEECGIDKSSLKKIILGMINNKEIFADYFKSSKVVVFDKRSNIDNIDEILNTYEISSKESRKVTKANN